MEPTTIFLLVCVIVLIYLVYHSYTYNASLLMSSITPANVETKLTPPVPATGTYLNSDFTFSIWVNMNDWNSMYGYYKNIISYGKTVNICFGKTVNEVIVSLLTNGNATSASSYEVRSVLQSVPFQKWVHMAFSVSGQTMDSYMNGKLVNTQIISGNMQKPNASDSITIGGKSAKPTDACASAGQLASDSSMGCSPYSNSVSSPSDNTNPGFSGWVKQFQYWPAGTDPQTIWNIYQQSNSSDTFANFFGNYGLTIALTNNGVAQNSISI